MSVFTEAAAGGARFLDSRVPMWFVDVNLETLDLSDCYDCVWGQLAGGVCEGACYDTVTDRKLPDERFEEVAAKLGLERRLTTDEMAGLGFTLLHGWQMYFPELTEAWVEEICRRREAYLIG